MNNGTLNWVVTALLIPLAFGAYVYAFAIDSKAEQRAETVREAAVELAQVVKAEAEQRAIEIKQDLSARISESESRVREALKELKDLIKNGGKPTP